MDERVGKSNSRGYRYVLQEWLGEDKAVQRTDFSFFHDDTQKHRDYEYLYKTRESIRVPGSGNSLVIQRRSKRSSTVLDMCQAFSRGDTTRRGIWVAEKFL